MRDEPMVTPPLDGSAGTAPGPVRRWPRRALAALLVLALSLAAALLGAGVWLWHHGPAQARLLQSVGGLTLEGVTGRATGGPFAVARLRWQNADLTVDVEGLQWQDLAWQWRPHRGAWIGLTFDGAQAKAVKIERRGAPATASSPLQAPTSLRLPLALEAPGLRIGLVQLDGQPLATDLAADLHLAAEAGSHHRITRLQLSRGDLQLRGDLSIGADDDLPVAARLALATPPGHPLAVQATLRANGPLRRLQADADLQTEAGASLRAQATVTAFADWPLAALQLQTQDLDLARLAPGLPETALTGRAELADVSAGQPLRLQVALDNTKPGAWDAGRLPVRQAKGILQGRPETPDRLVFDGWLVGFGRAADDGQLSLSGTWDRAQLALTGQLQAVRLVTLDTRAPPATVDGSMTLTLRGLPLPGGTAAPGPQPLEGQVRLDLRGRGALPATARRPSPPMALRGAIAFALQTDRVLTFDVTDLVAGAGKAKATATVAARRDASGSWAVQTTGQLDHVDLALWWPAAGPSDLNGSWKADLQLPVATAGSAGATLLDTLRGDATAALERSQLSGVPVSGTASLRSAKQGLAVDAQLQAATNRLTFNGSTGAAASARMASQTWRAEVQAPALAALSPLLARLPGARDWLPEAGTLQATATAQGRWPSLQTTGRLQVDGLRVPQGRLTSGHLRWTLNGLSIDAPMALDVDVQGLAQAERRIDRLQVRLDGSLRAHRLQVQADSPLRPPPWIDTTDRGAGAATAAAPTSGTALRLQAQGRWQAAPSTARSASPPSSSAWGAGTWRGQLSSVRAGPRADGAAPWLSARDLVATVGLDAQGQPTLAELAPGRVEVFGGALAWQQARWQAPDQPGGAPRIALEARLEPLKVAPILARLQPEFGWHGDLVVGGKASVRSGARFDADITVERQGGDLGLTLAGSRRDLGLTTLRMALAAHDGHWVLSQALIGRQVGVFGGSQQLDTAATAAWPPDPTPLTGGLSLRVADASIWAPWLPPGWRLGGRMEASVSLGGQLGAPTATGELLGEQLLVRNIFEGVNLKDGAVRVRLDRREAVVETFRFQGGDGGALDLQGRVRYADAPQADLRLVLDQFRALDRVDRRVSLSGNADLGLREGRVSVQGRFNIDEGLVDVTADDAPSLGDDVVVVGRTDTQGRPLAVVDGGDGGDGAKSGMLSRADLDLRLGLGDALRLRGRGLDTLLRGQLRITTANNGKLQVRGVVNTADGSYTAYGQNLAIRRGRFSFTGDVANPRLDILALRADIDTPVGVIVSGFAVNPRVRLYSDPDLPEVEQLTWLLTGQAPQGQGRDEAALLQRAALALLAGDQGASDEGFLQKLGIDRLGVGRSDGGDTVVTIGKQLSKRLSIVYEKGLSAAGGTWALLYRIAGRTTLRARTGIENAVEVIWSWRWD